MAAALAGTARPSHRPPPGRMSPSPRSPRSAPRAPNGVARFRAYVCANHQDHARPVASSHERVLRPGRRVEEVPGSKASLLALDEQPALAAENEERLLIRLGVIDAALARLEDGHVDPELREFHRRVAVLVREPARRAPRLRSEPLGIAHVDDEPALGDGGEPGASVLKPRFGQEPDSRSPSDTSLTCASVRECPLSESSRLRSDDRHEDVDEIVTAVVLQGRACVISVSPLCEALRSRPDLRVDTWRLAVETHTCVAPAGEHPHVPRQNRTDHLPVEVQRRRCN